MTIYPRVTIGIVSYNRLYYLKALVSSILECIVYPDIQWVIIDGNSIEHGLRDYIEGLDFVQHKIFMDCTHAEAMSTIVEIATGEYIMILPEDVQFIRRGGWLADMVELVRNNESVGHIVFDAQRRQTIKSVFGPKIVKLFGRSIKLPFRKKIRRYQAAGGNVFLGCGRGRSPIAPAGIVSFGRTALWRKLGPWATTASRGQVSNDSSLGAEDYMLARYLRSGLRLEAFLMEYPVCADIITDPRGTKAKIRGGNRRYGRYEPPDGGNLYFKIWIADELPPLQSGLPSACFEDFVVPVNGKLPLDDYGNLLKVSVINDAEPFELIV